MNIVLQSRFWIALTLIWHIVLFYLSHQPYIDTPGISFNHQDKVLHLGYYALGSGFFYATLYFANSKISRQRCITWTMLFALFTGLSDEYHQSFIPMRTGNDLGDLAADVGGGILACCFAPFILSTLKRFVKP